MAVCEKIFIVGFSGAGKTALLGELKLNSLSDWEYFDDLDQLVVKNRGKGAVSVGKVVASAGWDQFRIFEREEIESWLEKEGKGVLALGGGALTQIVWDTYSKDPKIKFCFLDTPFATCWERIEKDENRLLAKNGMHEMKNAFDERNKLFRLIKWKLDGTLPLKTISSKFLRQLLDFHS